MSRLTRIYPIQTFHFKKREQTKINNNRVIHISISSSTNAVFFSKKEFISNLSKKSPSIACLKVDKLGGVS